VILFADASFLYNRYYPGESHSALARKIWERWNPSIISSAAAFSEFRMGVIYNSSNEDGWNAFQVDKRSGKISESPVEWEKVLSSLESALLQHPGVRVGLADGLHVAAAQQAGASHFLSFDFQQRAFARAVGLKTIPERMPREF
jgi:predicted nucleic acid-binding protein